MCYNPDDLPPDPPGAAGEATGYDMELVSSDGTHFQAYFAHPAPTVGDTTDPRSHVIIYPDVRGLHGFYRAFAMRLAEQGVHALAIDYFGRTAGLHTARDDSFEFMPHVQQVEFPNFLNDVRAGIAYLQDHAVAAGASSPAIFTLGFCMGGALSLLTAAEDLPLAGAIALYSGFGRRFAGTETTTMDRTQSIRVPVLGLYGGADTGIPAEQVQELEQNLDAAGVPNEIHIYPGAPHSFMDRKAQDYAEESADAWRRILGFIQQYTPGE